ncbi:MAG: hypothetical protein R2761_02435 [Acidimicrobiales bacterium]
MGLRWIAIVVASAAHGAVGVIVAASTLLMPNAAVVGLVGLWAAGAALLVRWRHRPFRLPAVPLAVLALWFAVAWAGDLLLGWTA